MMYHEILHRQVPLSMQQVVYMGRKFSAVRKMENLALILNSDVKSLKLMSLKPAYDDFFIPKPKGGKRHIQAPVKELKKTQGLVNDYLQCVYYPIRPAAAFGFLISPKDEKVPRNIFTNALTHLSNKHFLNVDLKDFFHAISADRVQQMLSAPPFQLSKTSASCLTRLCTYQDRLPMGAPSSPILSNLAAMKLDEKLDQLAQQRKWTYTRYADDLTFSSKEKIQASHLDEILEILEREKLPANPKKVKFQHRKDPAEITGLIMKKKKVDVSKTYIKGIREDIHVLNSLVSERMLMREIFDKKPVKKLRRSIQGQIQFVAFVRGDYHKSVIQLKQQLDQATEKYASS